MLFSTDNSWPANLLRIFEICHEKNEPYYGPYNKLLNYCFEDSFTFFIAPQNPPGDGAEGEEPNLRFFFMVFNADCRPVLIAEIKDDTWASCASFCLEADQQLRRQYDATLNSCPLPRLWGLSFLGTSVRVYHGDVATRTITPPYQARPHETFILPPGFLKGEWNLNILSHEGFDKMKEIVADITTTTAAL